MHFSISNQEGKKKHCLIQSMNSPYLSLKPTVHLKTPPKDTSSPNMTASVK